MSFCTAVNCMDGRVQLPVIEFLKKRFNADYVDSVTEAGPIQFFVGSGDQDILQSMISRVEVSVNKHGSQSIALCSHADCAGNPADDDIQQQQLVEAVKYVKDKFPQVEVIGLWINDNWQPQEYC